EGLEIIFLCIEMDCLMCGVKRMSEMADRCKWFWIVIIEVGVLNRRVRKGGLKCFEWFLEVRDFNVVDGM
uniref:hypothetical protein n=1 Tax=Bacillus altitudinis TaxID=293387 RepID=UPI001C92C55B